MFRLKRAYDRAAMSAAYGQEAAGHYKINYSLCHALRDWLQGFKEGLNTASRR